jgi:glutaconate CoA-transferase subunit A
VTNYAKDSHLLPAVTGSGGFVMSGYSSVVHALPSTHQYIGRKLYILPDCWSPIPPTDRLNRKRKDVCDKRTTMQEAVARQISDGINLGLGGFEDTRNPIAIVHEIIRQGVKDLTLSLSSSSISAELLAGAMILDPGHLNIGRVRFAGRNDGLIEVRSLLGYLLSTGLVQCDGGCNADIRFDTTPGSEELSPWQVHDVSDSGKIIVGREMMATPAFAEGMSEMWSTCRPDVGIVHVPAADMCGNARIIGSLCGCPDVARAAVRTIMSVDQVLPKENIETFSGLTEISSDDIDEVVEQSFGAMPGACHGHYWFDVRHLDEFRKICGEFRKTGDKEGLQKYYDRNIFGCETFEDFLNLQSSRTLQEIIRKDGAQPFALD